MTDVLKVAYYNPAPYVSVTVPDRWLMGVYHLNCPLSIPVADAIELRDLLDARIQEHMRA